MKNERQGWVLIVEPDRGLAASLCEALRAAHFEAIDTPDAESALKMVFSGVQFDSILVAFNLPRMSGADFCAVYRGREDLPAAKLIGMSRDHRCQHEMVAAGADQFLCKPFAIATLRAALTSPASLSGRDVEAT